MFLTSQLTIHSHLEVLKLFLNSYVNFVLNLIPPLKCFNLKLAILDVFTFL